MGSGPILTDQTNAIVRDNITKLYGIVASTPALLVTDGVGVTYACDVDLGITNPYPNGENQQIIALLGVPGTRNYQVDDSILTGTILRNVIISNNNSALIYANVGNPVIVERSASGQWQITGFAREMPGTRTRIPVNLKTKTIGAVTNRTITTRTLTLGELALYGGGFGAIKLGAVGVFIGGVLQYII